VTPSGAAKNMLTTIYKTIVVGNRTQAALYYWGVRHGPGQERETPERERS
jgi:hypothetical protein